MATYVPNATQTTEPVASQTVESAALEFRTLKTSINSRITTEIDDRIAGDAALQTELDGTQVTLVADELRITALEQLAFNGSTPGATVSQEYVATGLSSSFTLGIAPLTVASVDVFVNGFSIPPSEVSVVGAVVTLAIWPVAGDEVVIKANIPLQLGITDANSVQFIQSGTGAVPRTVQDKNREHKSIDDFGASPSNTAAANAAAILDAIDSGYPLEVPSGTYTCANLTSTRTGQIEMVGADSQELGRGTSFIQFVDDGTTTGIGWDLDSFNTLVFKNLLFKPNVAVDGRIAIGNFTGIQSYSALASRTWHTENCRFEGFSKAGIYTQSTIASEFKTTTGYRCKAIIKADPGFFPVAGTTTRFVSGYNSECTYAHDVANMSQSYWEDVIYEYNTRGVNTSASIQNTVINCYAEGNTEYGGFFPDSGNMVFQNNYSNGAGDQWVSTGATGSFGFDAIGSTKIERSGLTARQLQMYDRNGTLAERIKASNTNYSGLTGIEDSAGTFLGIVPKRIAAQQSGQADRQDMFFVSGTTVYGAPTGWTITHTSTGLWTVTWPSPLTGNPRWPFIFTQGLPSSTTSFIDIITTVRARDSGGVWASFQNMSVGFELRIYTIDPTTGIMTLSDNGAVVSVNW